MTPMADDRLAIRIPPDLKRTVEQEAASQNLTLTAFTIEALYVRLAWIAAMRAIEAGMTTDDARDTATIIERLAKVAAGK